MVFISNAKAQNIKKIIESMPEERIANQTDSYMQCPSCNAWVKQNDQFCNKCGNKLH